MTESSNLFVVPEPEDGSLLGAIERSLSGPSTHLGDLPVLPDSALGDPYLARQLLELHRHWEIRPQPTRGLLARLRTRLVWWLLGSEIQQVNAIHATLVRLVDSLLVQLDQDRAELRRVAEHLAYTQERS